MYKFKAENNTKKITYLLFVVALFLCYLNYNFADTDLTSILVLNSYHDGYKWSDDTKKGIKDVLDDSEFDYHLRIEHMDTKNISSDEYLDDLYSLYKSKYSVDEFDVIISADDNALKFLLQYRDELFEDTPIFFCGINTLTIHDLEDVENIYGVVEKYSIAETTEMALKINPKINNVYLVVDDSITGKAAKCNAIENMKKYDGFLNFEIVKGVNYQEILAFTETLDPVESIVIQSFYVVDEDGSTYPLEYTARKLIEKSNAPVFAVYPFGFGEGSVGGKFVEGYTQGARVAAMVCEYIITGSYEKDRFIVDSSVNLSYFDYKVIKELGYDIKNIPSDSQIINKPISFYKRNARIINISLAVVMLLLIYVYLLKRQVNAQSSSIIATQKQLMASEKMAALGRLVAGVSHEINTPIGIGVTLSSYMHKETEAISCDFKDKKLSSKILKEYLGDMNSSLEVMMSTMNRATVLVQSFKQVAVDQSIDEKRSIELSEYIGEILSSLNSELKKKSVNVEVEAKESINLYTYTGAIYQIISNLIMNSLKHGFNAKKTGNVDIKIMKKTAGFSSSKKDEVHIIYMDDGEGIEESNLIKIYDPFYTTKINEGGSGLGLNIVYNLIVDRLKGSIECRSQLGEFTQFDIKFPIEIEDIIYSEDEL